MKCATSSEKSLIFAMLALLLIMVLSAIHAYDRTTWFMEVAPIFISLPVMMATYRRFPLTTLLYVLISFHALAMGRARTNSSARRAIRGILNRTCCLPLSGR